MAESQSSSSSQSIPSYTLMQANKKIWWREDLEPALKPSMRAILEDYSHIPNSEVLTHVAAIREKAWRIRSYPCVGLGAFLSPQIIYTPAYETIIDRLKHGARMLEIGAFIGQDIRTLVAAGTPSANIVAVDLVDFWGLGFEMFRDLDTFKAQYIRDDLLSPGCFVSKDSDGSASETGHGAARTSLVSVRHTADIVYVAALLHQWPRASQIIACAEIIQQTKPGPGAVFTGWQVGLKDARAFDWDKRTAAAANDDSPFAHNAQSFREMWQEAARLTETRWRVEVRERRWEEYDMKEPGFLPSGESLIIDWIITREG